MPNPIYISNQDVMSRNQDDKTSPIIPYNLVSITFISYLPNISFKEKQWLELKITTKIYLLPNF